MTASAVTQAPEAVVPEAQRFGAARIVERGRHEELLARQGRYTRLWREHERARGWRPGAGVPDADSVAHAGG